jgi:glycosyltransferase involved in cell wall biosynthesis
MDIYITSLKINKHNLKTNMSDEKMRVLFRGWFNIPHSYSMVNCFQIVHLYKSYAKDVEFYIEEMPYFRQEWNAVKKLVYNQEYNEIIRNFREWRGEQVDLIYSITYPYNMDMTVVNGCRIPKCVFYTSEFATLEPNYFSCTQTNLSNDSSISEYIVNNKDLFMTSPSVWSSLGMVKYGLPETRNRVITHGVDPTVFKYDVSSRKRVRDFYKVKPTDILMINIGSMTRNKGMMFILQILNILVNRLGKRYYKLLLKGTGDLYQSKTFLEIYFTELRNANAITSEEMNTLLADNIIFTDKTLSYDKINELFNAADLYFSPYFAEGFNLTPLEGLTAGLPLMIPRTGSTREYINDIYNGGGEDHIIYIESEVVENETGYKQNNIDFNRLFQLFLDNEDKIKMLQNQRDNGGVPSYKKMNEFIKSEYSWSRVADLMFNYFRYIIDECK